MGSTFKNDRVQWNYSISYVHVPTHRPWGNGVERYKEKYTQLVSIYLFYAKGKALNFHRIKFKYLHVYENTTDHLRIYLKEWKWQQYCTFKHENIEPYRLKNWNSKKIKKKNKDESHAITLYGCTLKNI